MTTNSAFPIVFDWHEPPEMADEPEPAFLHCAVDGHVNDVFLLAYRAKDGSYAVLQFESEYPEAFNIKIDIALGTHPLDSHGLKPGRFHKVYPGSGLPTYYIVTFPRATYELKAEHGVGVAASNLKGQSSLEALLNAGGRAAGWRMPPVETSGRFSTDRDVGARE